MVLLQGPSVPPQVTPAVNGPEKAAPSARSTQIPSGVFRPAAVVAVVALEMNTRPKFVLAGFFSTEIPVGV
ncbi:MAG: hypothetical protein BWX68_02894 [Verrucomicrobia bacterium ADurb.Bin063]|nr:MAG: hypothetical protein BWX68_02894 [Verrucomicrobia bacterium ADurb.Bin063]